MGRVAIIDYGMCNLDSMARAVECCGHEPSVVSEGAGLGDAAHVILPGVGAFPDAMAQLESRGFVEALAREVERGIPLLGVCLGMQLLMTRGTEGRPTPGLNLIPGEVRRLEPGEGQRIPHVGWNAVQHRPSCGLFAGIEQDTDFYFVHSYAAYPDDAKHVTAKTPYAGGFASAIGSGGVSGVQFHPEKSQRAGLALLGNFLREA